MYIYKKYSPNDILLVWNMATAIASQNSSQYRKDRCGALICFNQHGNRESDYGWEIDHIIPKSKGGQHVKNNVQPLHWKNNMAKADGPLVCAVQ